MSDDTRRQQYQRAKEILDGAGWLFDDYTRGQANLIMLTTPDQRDEREHAYVRASVAGEIKGGLARFVEEYELDAKRAADKAERASKTRAELRAERLNASKERRHGR